MQGDSIASHLGTTSAMVTSYKTHVEIVHTFCQTIDHSNCKALQETNHRKALKVEQTTVCRGGCGCSRGSSDGRGCSPGRGTPSGRNPGHTGGRYHNWVPKEEYDKMDEESYSCLIHDQIAHGEYETNNTSSQSTVATSSTSAAPATQVQVSPTPMNVVADTPSTLSTTPSSVRTNSAPWSASMAMINSSSSQ